MFSGKIWDVRYDVPCFSFILLRAHGHMTNFNLWIILSSGRWCGHWCQQGWVNHFRLHVKKKKSSRWMRNVCQIAFNNILFYFILLLISSWAICEYLFQHHRFGSHVSACWCKFVIQIWHFDTDLKDNDTVCMVKDELVICGNPLTLFQMFYILLRHLQGIIWIRFDTYMFMFLLVQFSVVG